MNLNSVYRCEFDHVTFGGDLSHTCTDPDRFLEFILSGKFNEDNVCSLITHLEDTLEIYTGYVEPCEK